MSGDKSKQEVKGVVAKYIGTSNEIIGFNDTVYMIKNEADLRFGGGTNLSLALKEAQTKQARFVTILTDGIPNDVSATIQASETLKNNNTVICSVFVSSDSNIEIPDVLKQISDEVFITNEISKVSKLCSSELKIKLLNAKTAVTKSVDINRYAF
jgi:uncharacterized protein YegL